MISSKKYFYLTFITSLLYVFVGTIILIWSNVYVLDNLTLLSSFGRLLDNVVCNILFFPSYILGVCFGFGNVFFEIIGQVISFFFFWRLTYCYFKYRSSKTLPAKKTLLITLFSFVAICIVAFIANYFITNYQVGKYYENKLGNSNMESLYK
jgi:hypothetical protein